MMRRCKPASGRMTISAAVDIPEEIVLKILSGLPVKSLLRFSCVCKSWWVTINKNPWFISQNLSRSTVNANGGNLLILSLQVRGTPTKTLRLDMLLDANSGTFKDHICTPLNIPSSFEDRSLAVISSINGLIIFHKRFSSKGYTVWNPATGRFKNINLERKLNDGRQLVRRFVGFGVAPGDLSYKLVSIQICRKNRTEKGSDIVLIQVYSSLSGLWREIDAASTFPTDYDIRIREGDFYAFWRSELGIFAKGVLYWILDQKFILGFNIHDEVFFQLTMPEFHGIHVEDFFKLAEIKGSIALIPTSTLHGLYYAWEMNERAEVWTKRLLGPPDSKFLRMLGHWKSYMFVVKNIPMGNLRIQIPKACPSVGSETQEISTFPWEERVIQGAYNYVESLVPVE